MRLSKKHRYFIGWSIFGVCRFTGFASCCQKAFVNTCSQHIGLHRVSVCRVIGSVIKLSFAFCNIRKQIFNFINVRFCEGFQKICNFVDTLLLHVDHCCLQFLSRRISGLHELPPFLMRLEKRMSSVHWRLESSSCSVPHGRRYSPVTNINIFTEYKRLEDGIVGGWGAGEPVAWWNGRRSWGNDRDLTSHGEEFTGKVNATTAVSQHLKHLVHTYLT